MRVFGSGPTFFYANNPIDKNAIFLVMFSKKKMVSFSSADVRRLLRYLIFGLTIEECWVRSKDALEHDVEAAGQEEEGGKDDEEHVGDFTTTVTGHQLFGRRNGAAHHFELLLRVWNSLRWLHCMRQTSDEASR